MTQITIPKIVFEGTQEEALAMNKTSYQKDWNFYVADQAVMDRLNGKLPVIEVYPGEQYYIDWRLKEFRHTENFSNRILVNDLEPIEDGRVYRMLFDKETKRNAEPLKGNENPDHIVFIDIPYELKLDPISVAREYGMKEIELLHSFPIQKELKATVRELSGQEKKELKNYLKKLSERKQMKNKTKRGRKLR